jgi:prolyl-tRNA synthetase
LGIARCPYQAKEVKAVRRVDGHKSQISTADIKTTIPATLEEIHHLMFNKAKKAYDDHIVKVEKFEDVVPSLDQKNVLIMPWCEAEKCEDDIKERSATMLVC